jgi:hypothetical protein
MEAQDALWRQQGLTPTEEERFDLASGLHEDTLAKAAGALGQTFAGAVLTDDLAAFEVLCATDGIDPERLGTFGFSGGGGRSLLLAALDHRVAACVVSCMMATFASQVLQEAGVTCHEYTLTTEGALAALAPHSPTTSVGTRSRPDRTDSMARSRSCIRNRRP